MLYEFLLFVHIVCAVIWVGGAVYGQVLGVRIARSDDPTDLPKFGRNVEFIGTRLFLPASILLFLAGLALTALSWGFTQLWISASMLLWITSALVGSLYLGPRAKKAADLFETEGPSSVAGRALVSRLSVVSRIELVSFAVIIALMVFKPGAGG